MTDCTVASNLMRELAPTGTDKARMGVVSTKLQWSWSRVKSIWYGEARRIDAWEMDALRAAIRKREIEEGRREYRELDERLRRIEATLAVVYQDVDSAAFDEVRKAVVGPGPVDRSRTGRDGD